MRGRAQRHVIYNVVAMFIVVHYSSSVDASCDEVLCCVTDGSSLLYCRDPWCRQGAKHPLHDGG